MKKLFVIVALIAVFPATAKSALRPPYLTQAKPVYGDVNIRHPSPGGPWTYRGDWVMAIFDYDWINGNPNVRRLTYRVCRVGKNRLCVTRTWRGRPDIWLVRVLDWVGNRRYIEFTWSVGGKRRGVARLGIYE